MLRAGHSAQLVLGPIIWALWFVVIYAALSVVCSVAPPAAGNGPLTWLNGGLLLLTVLVSLLLFGVGLRCWRASRKAESEARFFSRTAAGTYVLSGVATLLIGVPIMVLPPCL